MLPSHTILLWTAHPILQYSAFNHKLPLATDHQNFRIKPAAARMPAETAGACSSKGLQVLGELDLLRGPLRFFKVRPAQLLQQSLLVCLHLAVPAAQIIVGQALVQGLQRGCIPGQEGTKRRQWRQKQGHGEEGMSAGVWQYSMVDRAVHADHDPTTMKLQHSAS